MLGAIKKIRDEACRAHPDSDTFTIQQIAFIVEAYTKIDEVEYIGFPAGQDNPIFGEFRRRSYFVPYDGERTAVQIRYAQHLERDWRRFVVVKELCHALDTTHGVHTATSESVVSLIVDLSLLSASAENYHRVEKRLAVQAEQLAEVGAVEILVPLARRKELIASGEFAREGAAGMAARFRIPPPYIEMAFRDSYIEIIESLIG